jgi:hypothetical protein
MQYGFDFGPWTHPIFNELAREKFGAKLGPTSVGTMLARLWVARAITHSVINAMWQ